MIGNIKVFNPKGELVKTINGQKELDAKYKELADSFPKSVKGTTLHLGATMITCSICKKEVEGRTNQITCGGESCIRERWRLKNYPKASRVFKCVECGIEVKTRHHNKKTCGTEECFRAYNNNREKARLRRKRNTNIQNKETV